MRRRLAAASVLGAAVLGFVGMASPAMASAGAAAAPLTAGQPSSAAAPQKVNFNKPDSTYALVTYKSVPKGLDISKISFTGIMTGKGCITAVLYKNHQATRTTPKQCFSKGQRVTATWTNFGFRPYNTRYDIGFFGPGHPAGTEAFVVTK